MAEHSLTAADICKLFKRGKNFWTEHATLYIATRGFPPPLPGPGRKRWSKAQVETWFATGGKTYDAATGEIARAAADDAIARNIASYGAERHHG